MTEAVLAPFVAKLVEIFDVIDSWSRLISTLTIFNGMRIRSILRILKSLPRLSSPLISNYKR